MENSTPAIEFVDRVVTLPELRRLASAVDWGDHYDWTTMEPRSPPPCVA